jgi:hypothetical protein
VSCSSEELQLLRIRRRELEEIRDTHVFNVKFILPFHLEIPESISQLATEVISGTVTASSKLKRRSNFIIKIWASLLGSNLPAVLRIQIRDPVLF